MTAAAAAPPLSTSIARRHAGMRGMTLIELLLVLTVMMIFAAMGMAELVSNYSHARVRRTTAILTADLQYAQDMAARQRRPVVVIVNPSLRFYIIRDRANSVVYRERFVGDDTDYGIGTLTATPSASVELFPNGAAGTTTTFTIGAQSYQRQVTLTQAGQIRLVPLAP
jgi:type II secretory pathway pseudopilin PulG